MKRPPPRVLPASRIRWCDACGRRRRFREVRPDDWQCPCAGEVLAPAKTSFLVDVTEEDMRRGLPFNGYRCPVARACRRAGLRNAAVVETAIDIWPKGGHLVRLELLPEICRWIEVFDSFNEDRERLRPFRFRVELGPSPALQGIVLETAPSALVREKTNDDHR